MANKLQIYFFYFVVIVLIFIVAFSIFGPKATVSSLTDIHFSTNKSSRLYFKNLRAYYYKKEENEKAMFNLYRLKKETEMGFRFTIVENWLHDEAYIITEADSVFYEDETLQLCFIGDKKTDTLLLTDFDREAYYTFAANCYNRLLAENKVFIIHKNERTPLTAEKRTAMKIVLKDYFKLVNRLR